MSRNLQILLEAVKIIKIKKTKSKTKGPPKISSITRVVEEPKEPKYWAGLRKRLGELNKQQSVLITPIERWSTRLSNKTWQAK